VNEETIKTGVLDVLTRIVPEAQGEAIDPEVTFRDQFDIDSLDFLNFVLSLEEAFGVKVPEADYPRLSTFQGAVTYLSALLAAQVE
jgi:acyl carrier protein